MGQADLPRLIEYNQIIRCELRQTPSAKHGASGCHRRESGAPKYLPCLRSQGLSGLLHSHLPGVVSSDVGRIRSSGFELNQPFLCRLINHSKKVPAILVETGAEMVSNPAALVAKGNLPALDHSVIDCNQSLIDCDIRG